MTPKEKAIQLLGKYETLMMWDKSVTNLFPVAKKCTLLAVDEIILSMWIDTGIDYWNEVKSEIEKL